METKKNSSPFPHILAASVFCEDDQLNLIAMLDACRWSSRTGDFFRFDTLERDTEEAELCSFVRSKGSELGLIEVLQDAFALDLAVPEQIEFHRYTISCGIGAHTDAETREVRLIINLNKTWDVKHGGIWIVSSDSRLCTGRKYIPPISNTGFAFPTSKTSFHAVSVRRTATAYAVTLKYPVR